MRTLVVLAVIGVCSASTYQAHNPDHSYSVPVQPRWRGPVAATVPAGVNGRIEQIPDTPEVAAAKNDFFRAYNNQLAAVSYGTPGYAPSPPVSHGPVVSAFTPDVPSYPYGFPATTYNVAPVQVRDTPEVAAAKAEFFRTYERQAAAAAAAPDDYTRY
ncbi:cuticle protein CP1499-like [Homarus americanus]|uniref:cuticle protein CP1499-like n=1 Tax=Homarus americanus TaxID=6706 RepID=UPI001C4500B6|nr:cuticle protein CP1499-like [Homarus americanus]